MFQPIENALCNTFLQALYKRSTSQIHERAVTGLPAKKYGIALPYPTQTASDNWAVSCVITGNLVTEIRGTDDFQLGDYALLMGEGRYEIQQLHDEAAETALGEAWDATYM